jgi:hypothetical protein
MYLCTPKYDERVVKKVDEKKLNKHLVDRVFILYFCSRFCEGLFLSRKKFCDLEKKVFLHGGLSVTFAARL